MPKKVTSNAGVNYRAIPLFKTPETGKPATLDEAARSVEIIAATEAPVMVIDWERYEMVPEVLLMSGCQLPPGGQVPLLDTHQRYDTSTVIGSVRDLRVSGAELLGTAVYSSAPEAEGPYLKMTEGHLTDYSVGYRYDKKDAIFFPDGETGIVDGRTFTGPVKVVRKWQVKETSACPIGADELAKARSATPTEPTRAVKEKMIMEEKIRAFLESRGLPKGATEEEAFRFMEGLDVKPATAPANVRTEDDIRAEAVRSEQGRIAEIRGICSRANFDETKIETFIKNNDSPEAVRKAAFDALTAAPTNTVGHRQTLETGVDERDKFRAAAIDGIMISAGRAPEKCAEGAHDLAGIGLRRLAAESLRISGKNSMGNEREMIGRALTTSDFPLILANIANKSLADGYASAAENWMKWCGTGSVTDFKTNTVVRAGEMSDLDEVREEDEYKYGARAEAQEQFNIATYGKLFAISRQAIINDDLAALTDIPAAHGEAAARKIGDLAYAVLTANSAMGDGVALFHANHNNLGTAGVVGSATISEALKLMSLQKDISGKRNLNIAPKFIIAPPSIAFAIETFLKSSVIGTQANPNQVNIYANLVDMVFEPRLYDNSATAWYLAGEKGKTVKLFFLGGNQSAYMETRQGWTVDGVEYKVRIDAGAKAVDWKSLYKNAGA